MPRAATLKALGVPLFSIGQVAPARAGDRLVEAEAEGGYQGFVWRAGQLVGAILLGDARLAPQVQRLVETGTVCPPLDTAAEVIRFLDNQV
jgi:NAD(P)H-nitrite reductase large subunit